jgi:ATP-dependent helicase IRC3
MMSEFRLRPYQKVAVSAVVSRYSAGERRMLLYLPTGAGKTVIATFIIAALRRANVRRCLFVAHRREILDQTARTLRRHLPNARVELERGEQQTDGTADITIASVQSLVRRKERYDPSAFDLIVCDECHHALSPSWERVLEYFRGRAGTGTLLLGMTATPRRTDGRSALEVFGEVAFEISRAELEDLGYLVPMRYFGVQSDLMLDRVELSGGDFQVGALSRVMDTPAHRALALKAWLERRSAHPGPAMRTIVFCAGVEHALHLAQDFCALGVSAEKIDGKTKDRDQLIERFRAGGLQVLTNYGVLTEGFDDPAVSCILMARPTTSPLVYTQCIGRGLRPAPSKTHCTVIDLVDRSTHQLQYGVVQMAGLPTRWRTRGGDPFRQSRALRGIKVTSPEAFLRIRNASSLEEVQAILMSLPPQVVVAGLDGEPVLRYAPAEDPTSREQCERAISALLRQVHARGVRVTIDDTCVHLAFRDPEIDNERYAYLKWHIEQVTGRSVEYDTAVRKRKHQLSNPRALLKSMLPERCRIHALESANSTNELVAHVDGLSPGEMAALASDFQEEFGVRVSLKGQMALF